MGKFGKFGNGLKALAVATMLTGVAEAQETNGNVVLAAATDTSTQVRDCREERRELILKLRVEGVDKDGLRERVGEAISACRRENIETYKAQSEAAQTELARLDAEFSEMRAWLQARGLDVNKEGHITDREGRVLAVIQAETAELRESTAELRESTAELRESTAALGAEIQTIQLRIDTLEEEYQEILNDFRTFLNGNA